MRSDEFSCGRCESRWSGVAMAHCSVCHRTFTAISGFDKHRRAGECLDPASVGLELKTSVRGRARHLAAWGEPFGHAPMGPRAQTYPFQPHGLVPERLSGVEGG